MDFSLILKAGERLGLYLDPVIHFWFAPELNDYEPSFPSTDVYSYGKLIGNVETCIIKNEDLKQSLQQLCLQATKEHPEDRPTLNTLKKELEKIVSSFRGKSRTMEAN